MLVEVRGMDVLVRVPSASLFWGSNPSLRFSTVVSTRNCVTVEIEQCKSDCLTREKCKDLPFYQGARRFKRTADALCI